MLATKVEFDVVLMFPNKDLELDLNRYTGNEPQILEALLQKGFVKNKKGYFTRKGREYFSDEEESRFIEARLSSFLESNYDNHDRSCAYRDYNKYVLTCPRKVTLSFAFKTSDFIGDPLYYDGEINSLLIEHGFFNKKGYLTSKAVAVLDEQGLSVNPERKAVIK